MEPVQAAVLAALIETEQGPAFLMEIRSLSVPQPGEICFPGGHMDPGESPERTALREAKEELGIDPGSVRVAEILEPEHMWKGQIYPVIAFADPSVLSSLTVSEEEVSGIFLLPLRWLRENAPAHYDLSDYENDRLPALLREYLTHYRSVRDSGIDTWYWEYRGHGIWGLTARILRRLLTADSLKRI